MSTRRLLSLAVLGSLSIALLVVSQASWAQEVTASIVGTITDQSGAPIEGATVKARLGGSWHLAFTASHEWLVGTVLPGCRRQLPVKSQPQEGVFR